ncbi:MAG: YkgJ family cysteine cluster protein [Bacteroidota bacterium]
MQNKNKFNKDLQESNICIKCGMCCNGTLFFWAKIYEGETIDNELEMKRVQIKHKDTEGLSLPCSYLKDSVCSIYYSSNPQRPLICNSFKCKLLKKYEKREISYENALMIIENTKALVANFDNKIKNSFPDIASKSIQVKIRRLNEKHNESLTQIAFRKNYGKILLDSLILNKMFEKYFIKAEIITKGTNT